ncbi:Flavodoxin reductases (ferredoxin-NADPH reductases) family 1 [Geitlerinema sp. FC II]|nr:Flavodoxin reductases (ferredoxin-NADPH reductases) family 1 [Geitlerinema sp. FC II]
MTIATTLVNLEGRVLLKNVSWDTYDRLLADLGDQRNIRLHYDRGFLEIMTPLLEHENPKRILEKTIDSLADVLDWEVLSAGSTTLKRKDLERGSEPDSGFYIQNEQQVKGKRTIDLPNDPPPDLIIEVDVTSSSVNREAIYGAMGVPEIWRCDRGVVTFLQLQDGNYIEIDRSIAFPILPASKATEILEQSQTVGETTLFREFRRWVTAQLETEGSS